MAISLTFFYFLALGVYSQIYLLGTKDLVTTQKTRLFTEWKNNYRENYNLQEEAYRELVFSNNLNEINRHNSNPARTYDMGLNQFSALTTDEFRQKYLLTSPLLSSAPLVSQSKPKGPRNLQASLPSSINWVTQQKVTPVLDQGQCGSCWAFSATAALESAYLIDKSTNLSLSAQELVDCSSRFGNHGCNGGWPTNAYNYIIFNGILPTSSYPYAAINQLCQRPRIRQKTYSMSSYGMISLAGCERTKLELVSRPLSVTVDSTYWSPYSKGVFTCNSTAINHGVLLVGYESSGQWIIKNSWGTGWGEDGYIRLASGNSCAVCDNLMPAFT